jgi:valyl-tRNA synthetase
LAEGAKLALLLVSEARKVKTAQKIRFGASVSVLQIKCPNDKQDILKPFLRDISSLAKAGEITVIDGDNIEVSIVE